MSTPFHIVIWLDHQIARIYALTRETAQESVIHTPDTGKGHVHHHSGTQGAGHVELDRVFLDNISSAIGDAREILIVGPAQAKTGLKTFLERHKPLQAACIKGVEAMDHANPAEIVEFARHFFLLADKMRQPAK